MDVVTLLQQGILTYFPPHKMALALQQHLAPRVIQANGFSSKTISIFQSILAGCKFSVAFTRAYLLRAYQKIDTDNPAANLGVLVDDTSFFAQAPTFSQLLDLLAPAEITFAQKVKKNLSYFYLLKEQL